MKERIPHGSVWFHSKMKSWVVDFHDAQGERWVLKAGSSKALATAMLNAKLQQIARDGLSGLQAVEEKKFSEVAAEYMKYARANKRSWARDELSLKHLTKSFGDRALTQISVKDVEEYKAMRRESRKPATTNRELACLKHLFTKAIIWGYARENPVKKVKLFRENNQRVRFLEPNERARLLAFCSKQLKPLLCVALNTGLRMGELLALTWADVDLARRSIHVKDSKSGEGRHVPLNAEALSALQSEPRHIDCPSVFFNRDGHPYRSARTAFETACKRAGITDFRPHDCRHDFASRLAMSGVDLNTIRELLGHRSIGMTARYAHLSPQFKQAAVDRLSASWSSKNAEKPKKVVNI
ncbi:MAG: tyrosine-type recombinase/integrase [Planctomycetota bacterium]|nr:tyrosine-type recombinase/integrase [Planctomycetota bacterium]